MEYSIWSIVPPILIITLVILTRKIVLSLGLGILLASFIAANGSITYAIQAILQAVTGLFYDDGGWNSGNLYVLGFLLLLGALTGLISALGGNRAFGQAIGRRIHTKQGAQLMTATCGISLFPDDVFNMFVTSQITGPVIDHAKVPRTKLAYLIHSTSDPTCVICPLSSWGAYIIGILTSIFAAHSITDNPLVAFMLIATTNFYALSTLLFAFSSAAFDINIGRMRRSVKSRQLHGSSESSQGSIWDLIIPISLLIIGAIATMVITGYINSDAPSLMNIFSNSQVGLSLIIGAGLATFVGFLLYIRQVFANRQTISQLGSILGKGMKTTLPAVEILLYAWVLSDFIDQLETGSYLAGLIESIALPAAFLPLIFFLLTGAMAFATGTSWGTFAIMLPIAAQIAEVTDPSLLFFLMSAVLSGSLFGDHCSPVSDTTTVAAAAAGCTQIEHVATQLPYALICATITAISFLLLGISGMRWISYLFIIGVIGLLIHYFKYRTKGHGT